MLPNKVEGYFIVHDEIANLLKKESINAAKFLAHDIQIDGISIVANSAAVGVGGLVIALGITDGILDDTNRHLNSLSTNTILSWNALNNKTIFSNLLNWIFNNVIIIKCIWIFYISKTYNNSIIIKCIWFNNII